MLCTLCGSVLASIRLSTAHNNNYNNIIIIIIIITFLLLLLLLLVMIIIIIIIISLLIYSKQIAIYKLKVERRTIRTYLQFISIKKETTFNHDFILKEKKCVIKLQCYSYL